jgi:phage tail sheath gpL-like
MKFRNLSAPVQATLALAFVIALAWAFGIFHSPAWGTVPLMAMAISFGAIPSTLRVPFVTIEFDNSRASQGPALLPYRVLIIGQKLAAGSQAANTVVRATNADQLIALAGRGSILHRMARKYFQNNQFTETWFGVLADNGAGVAATGTITITGPATAAGTINLYLGGELVQVAVASGDAQNTIATND